MPWCQCRALPWLWGLISMPVILQQRKYTPSKALTEMLYSLYDCVSRSSSDNDTIYWVDMGLSTISRAKRDQTWREDVVTNGIGRVEGIAVDWIAGETNDILPKCCLQGTASKSMPILSEKL